MEYVLKAFGFLIGVVVAMFLTYQFVCVICRAWNRTMAEMRKEQQRGEK
jgi:hypothetical protein